MSYSLHSKLRRATVGVQNDASVRLGVASIWTADLASSIEGGGETHLGVGDHSQTGQAGGSVTAGNEGAQKWYLIPLNNTAYHLIAADSEALQVWTAGEWQEEIKIKPFTGEDGQFFKFERRP